MQRTHESNGGSRYRSGKQQPARYFAGVAGTVRSMIFF